LRRWNGGGEGGGGLVGQTRKKRPKKGERDNEKRIWTAKKPNSQGLGSKKKKSRVHGRKGSTVSRKKSRQTKATGSGKRAEKKKEVRGRKEGNGSFLQINHRGGWGGRKTLTNGRKKKKKGKKKKSTEQGAPYKRQKGVGERGKKKARCLRVAQFWEVRTTYKR